MKIQVKKESERAYVEVLETIKHMDSDLVKKIPQKLIQFFEEHKDENYQFKFDENIDIENQKISIEAGSILAMLMLNYIANEQEKNEINNILVIVTRYFGGILLGTGGLVRAYSEATMRALERVTYANEECGMEMLITISYSDFENFKYFCRKKNISIINTTYNKYIECTIEVNNEEKQNIIDNNEKNNFNILNNKVIKEKNIRKNIEI